MKIHFRFLCAYKTTTQHVYHKDEKDPANVTVGFQAVQQAPFGKATPAVTFTATMVKSAAECFEVGQEYDFVAVEAPKVAKQA